MNLKFEKWHGCKNDFVIVWIKKTEDYLRESLINRARQICTRNGSGVGADGIIILIQDQDDLPSQLMVINKDGSLAKTCGNGIRCAALSVLRYFHKTRKKNDRLDGVDFSIGDKKVSCRFFGDFQGDDALPHVVVDMGVPILNEELSLYDKARDFVTKVLKEESAPVTEWGLCEIANQHLVFFSEEADRGLQNRVALKLQSSEFWDGVNVHFATTDEISDDDISQATKLLGSKIEDLYRMVPWERGVGFTQSCGSGACALAAFLFDSGLVSRKSWLAIETPGGRLFVRQDEKDDPISLAGPGKLVFDGIMSF